jgi:hypothetical protein
MMPGTDIRLGGAVPIAERRRQRRHQASEVPGRKWLAGEQNSAERIQTGALQIPALKHLLAPASAAENKSKVDKSKWNGA